MKYLRTHHLDHRSTFISSLSLLPSFVLCFIFLLLLFPSVIDGAENFIWFAQLRSVTQSCNVQYEYILAPLKYLEINTPYSNDKLNSRGIINLGYGVPCPYFDGSFLFDRDCYDGTNDIYPFGYIMYNPDIRYKNWICLGEEPRLTRYHATYASITMYNIDPYYEQIPIPDPPEEFPKPVIPTLPNVTCSSVCIMGGQQITHLSNSSIPLITPTKSVLCMRIDTIFDNNNEPINYTVTWTEAEPLPYALVGAEAIYSNGTLLIIGGLRDNYDYDTTSSILEADVDPNTCLPYNWRNYGYSSSSRLGNQKLLQNWTTDNDAFENRTLLWVTEGPPTYPKLPGDYVYDSFPRIYISSYYPSILVGGGITIPWSLLLTPETYSIVDLYWRSVNNDNYYIPLQPLHDNIIIRNDSLDIMARDEINTTLFGNRKPMISVNLNLPVNIKNTLEYVEIIDRTMKYGDFFGIIPQNQKRKYRWFYHDGSYMYSMDTNGNTMNSWSNIYNEVIIDYDDGEFNVAELTFPAGSNLLLSSIGSRTDNFIMAIDTYTRITYVGYSTRCTPCAFAVEYTPTLCRYTPYEGTCSPCTTCFSADSLSPSYLLTPCTTVKDTVCGKCSICYGGPPLYSCNETADTVCDPEMEAFILQPKWKRMPVSSELDMQYLYIFITVSFIWLIVCAVYSIHVTQSIVHLSKAAADESTKQNDTGSTTEKIEAEETFTQIIRLPLFRHSLLSTIHYTAFFMFGAFTIFSYVYFNYSIITAVLTEESIVLSRSTMIRSDTLFLGKSLRNITFISCIVTCVFLSLSVILNAVWLLYQYRSVGSSVPIVYYIALPWVSLHHTLSLGWYRSFVVPLQQKNKNHRQKYSNSTGKADASKFNLKLALLNTFSSFCTDGIQMVILVNLSDVYGATMSSARPVTLGVALCGIFNILFSIYKLCLLLCNNNNNNHILSNEIGKFADAGSSGINTMEKDTVVQADYVFRNHSSGITPPPSTGSLTVHQSIINPISSMQLTPEVPINHKRVTNSGNKVALPMNNHGVPLNNYHREDTKRTAYSANVDHHNTISNTHTTDTIISNTSTGIDNNRANIVNGMMMVSSNPVSTWVGSTGGPILIPSVKKTNNVTAEINENDDNDSHLSESISTYDPVSNITATKNNTSANTTTTITNDDNIPNNSTSSSSHHHSLSRFRRIQAQLTGTRTSLTNPDPTIVAQGYFVYNVDESTSEHGTADYHSSAYTSSSSGAEIIYDMES